MDHNRNHHPPTIYLTGYHKDLEDRREALGRRAADEWSWLGAVSLGAVLVAVMCNLVGGC